MHEVEPKPQILVSQAVPLGAAEASGLRAIAGRSFWISLIGLACFLSGLLCLLWTRDAGNVASLWPANAIALAALLYRSPAERLPLAGAFTLAILAAHLLQGDGWGLSLLLAAANLAEVVAALLLIRRFLGDRHSPREPGVFLRFLVLAGVLAPLVGASIAAAGMQVSQGAVALDVWKTWWSSHAIGILVFFAISAHLLAR